MKNSDLSITVRLDLLCELIEQAASVPKLSETVDDLSRKYDGLHRLYSDLLEKIREID